MFDSPTPLTSKAANLDSAIGLDELLSKGPHFLGFYGSGDVDPGDSESEAPTSTVAEIMLDLDSESDHELESSEASHSRVNPRVRQRRRRMKHPEPAPIDPNGPPVSVYQRLVDYGLLRKITDIVLAKISIPWHLREDAVQEIHAAWSALQAKPEFVRGQVARYAYMSGQHAALKLRRTLGAVVVIPGALFRTGRDTPFMEGIGAAVNPKDVADYQDRIELSIDSSEELESHVSESFLNSRLSRITLNAKQRIVAHSILVERKSPHDVAASLDVTVCTVERMINQITNKLVEFDKGEELKAQSEDSGLSQEACPEKRSTRKRAPAASRASLPQKPVPVSAAE